MARTGMTTLISDLRGYAIAGTADYALGTINYWSDDQLQTALDRRVLSVYREELHPISSYDGGTLVYKEYRSSYGNFEQTSAGTAIFEIENAIGETIGTSAWSMDYTRGILTFGTNTAGSAYFLTGKSYDIYNAAADVWRQKAGQVAAAVDFSTDNMSVKRGGLQKQAMEMANYYAGMGRIQTVSFERDDTT